MLDRIIGNGYRFLTGRGFGAGTFRPGGLTLDCGGVLIFFLGTRAGRVISRFTEAGQHLCQFFPGLNFPVSFSPEPVGDRVFPLPTPDQPEVVSSHGIVRIFGEDFLKNTLGPAQVSGKVTRYPKLFLAGRLSASAANILS